MATVASLLRDHVTLAIRCVDRIFLHAYCPRLQTEGQVVRFLLDRGYPIPSPAALGKIGRQLVSDIEAFSARRSIPVVRFAKKDSKETIAGPHLERARAEGRCGVVLVGVAQERAEAWRGWKGRGGSAAHPHFCFRRQSVFVNHYYFYVFDKDFGPCFFKLCSYAPFSVWVWCNGNEWAKQQADRAGISYVAMDNGFTSSSDPRSLQRICDRLGAGAIRTLCERWLTELPSPFQPADRKAGYWYDLAFRQVECSDTRVFERPAQGRAWFEGCIREHLDLGRPEKVSLIFNRRITRRTPGRFATRIITRGVEPWIQIHYRASKLKQYFKANKALRTEATINDTRDFAIGRRVRRENFEALKRAGFAATRRLIDLELSSVACAPDADTLARVVLPSESDGLPAPALRFGDPRVVALLAALACCAHVAAGFTNASLRSLVAGFLGRSYSARQMTYDLRRLRRKGFIVRTEGTHTYALTPEGRSLSMFFTKTYARVVTPALPQLDPSLPDKVASTTPLGRAWRAFDRAIDDMLAASGMLAA
jgi:hypothetical protein